MFLGQYRHNLDSKGRLTVPARFRDLLVPEGAYVMQGFDLNLMVLPTSTFDSISRRVNRMSMTDPKTRLLRRLIFSTANYVEVDRAGRILIPLFLRETAKLESGITVVGNGDYFEIWSPELWDQQIEELQDPLSNADRFEGLILSSD
jgi:MraZ protein